jgi:chemotaxis family two-component system response regulator Rcp1
VSTRTIRRGYSLNLMSLPSVTCEKAPETYSVILLAEDNPGDVLLVQKALWKYHVLHQLHVVHDGAEALAWVSHIGEPGGTPQPDLLLLDLNLPKVDGRQILSEFRKHPGCSESPVIAVTSSDAPRDRARMDELGVARYFRKPMEYDAFLQLGAVVRDVVAEAAATSSGTHRPRESNPPARA